MWLDIGMPYGRPSNTQRAHTNTRASTLHRLVPANAHLWRILTRSDTHTWPMPLHISIHTCPGAVQRHALGRKIAARYQSAHKDKIVLRLQRGRISPNNRVAEIELSPRTSNARRKESLPLAMWLVLIKRLRRWKICNLKRLNQT